MQLNVMTKYEAMLQFGLALLSLFKTLIIVTICYVLSSTKSKSAGKFCNYVFCHLKKRNYIYHKTYYYYQQYEILLLE